MERDGKGGEARASPSEDIVDTCIYVCMYIVFLIYFLAVCAHAPSAERNWQLRVCVRSSRILPLAHL